MPAAIFSTPPGSSAGPRHPLLDLCRRARKHALGVLSGFGILGHHLAMELVRHATARSTEPIVGPPHLRDATELEQIEDLPEARLVPLSTASLPVKTRSITPNALATFPIAATRPHLLARARGLAVKPPVNGAARPALESKGSPRETSAIDRPTGVISSTNLWRGSSAAFSSARPEYATIALASRRIMMPTGSARETARRPKQTRCGPRCAFASPD
ncbi:hypothetical protein ACVWYH_002318 [Bradyrhizobium sp. GM24.11]